MFLNKIRISTTDVLVPVEAVGRDTEEEEEASASRVRGGNENRQAEQAVISWGGEGGRGRLPHPTQCGDNRHH